MLTFYGLIRSGALLWTSWYDVVMAMDPALPNCSPPFWFRGYFLFGDTESCSPEVSGFLTDLTALCQWPATSSASPLPFCDEVFPGNILLIAGHDWLYIVLGGGVLGHLGLGTLELGPQFQEDSRESYCVGDFGD